MSPVLGDTGVPVHRLRRCPSCGDVTERSTHCFVKGPPLIPQMDSSTLTEPCEVIERESFVEALALMRGEGDIGTATYYRVLELITPLEESE